MNGLIFTSVLEFLMIMMVFAKDQQRINSEQPQGIARTQKLIMIREWTELFVFERRC